VVGFLSKSAWKGDTELFLRSTAGFATGDAIRIGSAAGSENNTIAGFGSLLLGTPLARAYLAGTRVTVLSQGRAVANSSNKGEEAENKLVSQSEKKGKVTKSAEIDDKAVSQHKRKESAAKTAAKEAQGAAESQAKHIAENEQKKAVEFKQKSAEKQNKTEKKT